MELGLTLAAAAEAASMSKDTFRRVETGMTIRDSTYTNIDAALRWNAGSCIAILDGGDPSPADSAKVTQIPANGIEQEDIRQAVSSAIIATRGDLTGDEILAINDKVLAELRRRHLI